LPALEISRNSEEINPTATLSNFENTVANFDDYKALVCGTAPGNDLVCAVFHRDYPGDTVIETAPVSRLVVYDGGNGATVYRPTVATFSDHDALVCYGLATANFRVQCRALKLGGSYSHKPVDDAGEKSRLTLSAGPVLGLGNGIYEHSVATLDASGAPYAWAARRALICYNENFGGRPAKCRSLALSFPPKSDGTPGEDGNSPGILTAGPTTTIVPSSNAAAYPGVRFPTKQVLSTFDYFNAIVCYTTPISFRDPVFPFTATFWYFGVGRCSTISVDVATGSLVTAGDTQTFSAEGVRVHDVVVSAFKSKSGDPTRALFCYTTATTTGNYRVGYTTDVRCNVASRSGTGITYLNSQRTADGEASAGVSKEEVYSFYDGKDGVSTANWRPNELTLDTTDEYNAVVCTSKRDTFEANQPRCSSPSFGCNVGNGNIAWPSPIGGYLECRHLYIEGWGSSTYNSDVFNGVASASGPVNVGSVQRINLGAPGPRLKPPPIELVQSPHIDIAFGSGYSLTALDGYHGGFAPHPDHALARAVICFTRYNNLNAATSNAACKLIDFNPRSHVWQFNAPIDCVNGYNCERLRVDSRRLNATAA